MVLIISLKEDSEQVQAERSEGDWGRGQRGAGGEEGRGGGRRRTGVRARLGLRRALVLLVGEEGEEGAHGRLLVV